MDTRTRQVEEVVPSQPAHLRMYACGPTVYRYAHVGNLRTFMLHDLIARTADVVHGWQVSLVQNITDVGHLEDDSAIDAVGEDKVLAQARAEGKTPLEIARFYEEAFHRDCLALNIKPASAYPRASECIDLMLTLITDLVSKGHAYLGTDGTVYFDARSFPGYGAISGNRLEDLRAGHRLDAEASSAKRFHADWALWKSAGGNRLMVWDSPWGPGFPGWHIECSAMSLDLLGTSFDVHTGGIDLRFPHHEDERAQSEAAVGHEVVRHWVHGEHLLHEGRKMAKSTGNVVLVSDVLARGHDPLALRLFFLSGRYRQQMDMTAAALAGADKRLSRWRARVAEWAESPSAAAPESYVARVYDAFREDLDTPAALVVLGELEKDPSIPAGAKFEAFVHLDRLLGLDLARDVGRAADVLPAGARELLDARAAAREAKEWAESDRLRTDLAALGVAVTDSADGQAWSVA
ncbi:MAG: cysteinyl-tRNA synthetase [Frankiales bacterium]|nr:cysteinyl-tRNA synthetase [Frankiales bacterium]